MKLIKRQMKIVYKPITDNQWKDAYTKYLEANLINPTSPSTELYTSLENFKAYAHTMWHPILEIESDVESEEQFIERVTKTEARNKKFGDVQFIANVYGEIVSCVLF